MTNRSPAAPIVAGVLFDEVVAKVGPQRYREACERAWQTAAGVGRCGGARSFPGDLQTPPAEFADAWWHADASLGERLQMALRLYSEMPCYANTVALHGFYRDFHAGPRELLWTAYRGWLAGEDDRLADPVAHSLWIDFFEDEITVQDAWRAVTRRDIAPWQRRIARVLHVAGPVPWVLKAPLLDELAGDPRQHQAVFRALAGSAFDHLGELGPDAGELLERLTLRGRHAGPPGAARAPRAALRPPAAQPRARSSYAWQHASHARDPRRRRHGRRTGADPRHRRRPAARRRRLRGHAHLRAAAPSGWTSISSGWRARRRDLRLPFDADAVRADVDAR